MHILHKVSSQNKTLKTVHTVILL